MILVLLENGMIGTISQESRSNTIQSIIQVMMAVLYTGINKCRLLFLFAVRVIFGSIQGPTPGSELGGHSQRCSGDHVAWGLNLELPHAKLYYSVLFPYWGLALYVPSAHNVR